MEPAPNQSMDDWLNEGIEESVKKAMQNPPRTVFPTVPSGAGIPPKPEPPPEKSKTLQTLGITRGGVVRNASTVVRTSLNNPVANPKARASSILDSGAEGGLLKEAPGIGVPTLMAEMDANFEQRAKDRASGVLPSPPAEDGPPPPKEATMRSTLEELLEIARSNGGVFKVANRQFSLELELRSPY